MNAVTHPEELQLFGIEGGGKIHRLQAFNCEFAVCFRGDNVTLSGFSALSTTTRLSFCTACSLKLNSTTVCNPSALSRSRWFLLPTLCRPDVPNLLALSPARLASGYPVKKYRQNRATSVVRQTVRPVNCAAFRAIHTTRTDTGKDARKFPSVQWAISGELSALARANQKISFLFHASTKNEVFRSTQQLTASSKLSKRRTSASSSLKQSLSWSFTTYQGRFISCGDGLCLRSFVERVI